MRLTMQFEGLDRAAQRVRDLPRQLRFAGAQALNDAAFKAREDWQQEMQRVFDRPTPYIASSILVGRRAAPESLQAWVQPRYLGGKGVDPAKVLLAEVFGGVRRPKRFEVAMRRAGILPNNMAAVPASWLLADPAAGDGYGGIKGSFIVRLISYFGAFGEQGYRANMNDKGRARLAKKKLVKSSFAKTRFMTTRGVEYFVSRGRGTTVVSRRDAAAGQFADGRQQHLPAGIWQRSGIHGVVVKPVFLFTRMPRYQVRLNLAVLSERAMTQHFPPAYRARLNAALATAR